MPSSNWTRLLALALLAGCGAVDARDEPASRLRSEGAIGACTATSEHDRSEGVVVDCSAPSEERCWLAVPDGGFSERPLPALGGLLTVWASVVPSAQGIDGVVGMSSGTPARPEDLAVMVRFKADGSIDALNGDVFASVSPFQYGPESAYRLTFVLDAARRTYSAWINAELVAENYAFHGRDAPDRFVTALLSGSGALRACDFASSADD